MFVPMPEPAQKYAAKWFFTFKRATVMLYQ